MLRLGVAVGVFAACSSPPDTCDQNVVGDIATFAGGFGPGSSVTMQSERTITCPGGGSGNLSMIGTDNWNGTFTFDACTMTIDQDTLSLSGSLVFMFDAINGVDFGRSPMLAIHGMVDGCATAVDETCAVSWGDGGPQYSPYRTGTVCGRSFP